MMLRCDPSGIYDHWLRNKIPFEGPRVIAAIEAVGEVAGKVALVLGGVAVQARKDFRDSATVLFAMPPDSHSRSVVLLSNRSCDWAVLATLRDVLPIAPLINGDPM
ncbi:MAG: hypothetical protein OIF40_01525 [Mangrovicoccus sp.]|nr:hypothetical protein [Mangrovicoccus sp.]